MDPKVRKNNMMKVLKAKLSTPNYRVPVEKLYQFVNEIGVVKAGEEFTKWSKSMPNSWQKTAFAAAGKDLEKNLPISKAFGHLIKAEINNTNLGEKIAALPNVDQKGNNLAILMSNEINMYDSLKRQADGRKQQYEMNADTGTDYGGNTTEYDTIPSFLIPGETTFTPEFEKAFEENMDLSGSGMQNLNAIKMRTKEILDAEPNTHITQAILQAENEVVSGGNPKEKINKLRDVALNEAIMHENNQNEKMVQSLRNGGPLYLNTGGSWWDKFKNNYIVGPKFQQPEAFPTPRPENLVPYQDKILRDMGRTNEIPEPPPIPTGVQGLGAEGITGVGPSANMGLESGTMPYGKVSGTPNTGDWGSTYSPDVAIGNTGDPKFNNQVGNLPSSQFTYSNDVSQGNLGVPPIGMPVPDQLPQSKWSADKEIPFMDDTASAADQEKMYEDYIISNLDELSDQELQFAMDNSVSLNIDEAVEKELADRKAGIKKMVNPEEKRKNLIELAKNAANTGDKSALEFLHHMGEIDDEPTSDSTGLYSQDLYENMEDEPTADLGPLGQLNPKTNNNKSKSQINEEIKNDNTKVKGGTSGLGSDKAGTGSKVADDVIEKSTTQAKNSQDLMTLLSKKIDGMKTERDDEWNKSIMYGIAAYGLARLTGANFNQATNLAKMTMNATGNRSKMIQKSIDRYEQVHGDLETAKLKKSLGIDSGEKKTALMKNIAYYDDQLSKGLISKDEYDAAIKELRTPGAAAIDKTIGIQQAKSDQKSADEDKNKYTSAVESLARYQQLSQLLSRFESGAITGNVFWKTAKSYLDAIGIKTTIADEEAAQSQIKGLLLQERAKLRGQGTITDQETNMLEAVLPQVGNSPLGNWMIIESNKLYAKRNREIYEAWSELKVKAAEGNADAKRKIKLGYNDWKVGYVKSKEKTWNTQTQAVVNEVKNWNKPLFNDAWKKAVKSAKGAWVEIPTANGTKEYWKFHKGKWERRVF